MLVKLIKSPFVKNVVILATGTAAAQLITLLLTPVITRIYGPEAFGILGVFTAVISILMPIAALTYPIAIVLPKSDLEARSLVKLSLNTSLIIATLVTLVLFFFNGTIVEIFNIQSISSFLYFIPIVIVFASFLQIMEQWLIRKKEFKITAKVTFLQAFLTQGGKVGIGFVYPFAPALIIITVMAQILKPLMMIFFIRKKNPHRVKLKERHSMSLKAVARKYKDFPLYRSPEVLLNAVSQSIPILMLTSFFGPASAGFYTLGKTVLSAPSQLLAKSVTDVFYPRIAEASKNGEDLYSLIKRATSALALIGILPFGLIMLFAPYIFGTIFGSGWETAGEYTRWIAIWSYVGFLNRPSVAAIPVISAQLFFLNYSIISLILRVLAFVMGYLWFSNDLASIALFSITSAIMNLILIGSVMKKSKLSI